MITIYHNPKCSKSREGLELVKGKVKDLEIIDYMKTGISEKELKNIISLLKIKPIELVRTNEPIWKDFYKTREMSDDEIIKAMAENPKLIQRPIVINGKKAIIGRPVENINEIL